MPKKAAILKEDHKALAIWAASCAEHVLPYFEKEYPDDDRPRKAIEACRRWVETGIFTMSEIRKASLDAHAAARKTVDESPARFAARAAGQAVATAHVASHSIGAAWYGAKASDAAGDSGEREWQYGQLPENLRPYIHELARKKPGLKKVLRYPN